MTSAGTLVGIRDGHYQLHYHLPLAHVPDFDIFTHAHKFGAGEAETDQFKRDTPKICNV